VINIFENLLNVVLAWVLYRRFGVLGIAASFAIAYAVSSLWALQVLSYKLRDFPLRTLLGGLYRIVLASAVMAEAVWAVSRLVGSNVGLGAALRVSVAGAVGIGVLVGVLLLLGAPEITELRNRLRRTPQPAA